MENEAKDYCIVANVAEPDSILRIGAKCYLVMSAGNGGEKFAWYGLPINGTKRVTKWTKTIKMDQFRAVMIPDFLKRAFAEISVFGTKEEMKAIAMDLQDTRDRLKNGSR